MSDSTAPAKPRILAVDDDAEIRDMLRRGLGIEGFDVQVAADGEEALAAISSGPVDAVVLDVMLPGLNGLDVLRRIRVDDDVPVLYPERAGPRSRPDRGTRCRRRRLPAEAFCVWRAGRPAARCCAARSQATGKASILRTFTWTWARMRSGEPKRRCA